MKRIVLSCLLVSEMHSLAACAAKHVPDADTVTVELSVN